MVICVDAVPVASTYSKQSIYLLEKDGQWWW
jgi:hypothetical protein